MEFFHKKTNFPFMGTRRIWYTLSAVLMVVSLGAVVIHGLNYAVEFTGGVTAEASFAGQADLDRVRHGLETAGFKEPQVQNFGSSRDVLIRLAPDSKQSAAQVRARLDAALLQVDPQVKLQQVQIVGPQVGAELRQSSILAGVFTLAFIFVYLAVRFHTLRLSVGAIVAVMHDPILVLGFFSFTQIPFDLATVAALLAVIGYSLNDTVIVFDRIRERFAVNRRASPAEVLDESINSTLSRTIMTKVTTLIVVVMLYILGGATLHGFSAALILGVLAGTYSSIYIAAAISLDMGLRAEHIFPSEKRRQVDDMP
jgi:preprotein translocase subunit SecF